MWATSPDNPNRLFSTPLIFNRTEAPPADTTKRDRMIVIQLTPLPTQPRASESQPAAYTHPHTYMYCSPSSIRNGRLRPPLSSARALQLRQPRAPPRAPPASCSSDEATFAYLGRSYALRLLAETHGVSAGRAAQVYARVRDLRTADVALREAREFEQGSFEARMRALEYEEEEEDALTVQFGSSAPWAGYPAPSAGYRTPSAQLGSWSASIPPRTLSEIDADASEASFTPAERKHSNDPDPVDTQQREDHDARRSARKRRKQARADADALAEVQPRTMATAEIVPAPATPVRQKHQDVKDVNERVNLAQTPMPVKEKRKKKKKKHNATLTGVDAGPDIAML
ncbi:hypothetical protein C8J57DRAFT_1633005 [Mycena rebaudengoi]|nr:hypothetical protein C8J57DRAFT_1633005 [Mycena rebaudengoi]